MLEYTTRQDKRKINPFRTSVCQGQPDIMLLSKSASQVSQTHWWFNDFEVTDLRERNVHFHNVANDEPT